jgi:hypothetical protein
MYLDLAFVYGHVYPDPAYSESELRQLSAYASCLYSDTTNYLLIEASLPRPILIRKRWPEHANNAAQHENQE